MHIVYVLKSVKDGNLYVGCTKNIDGRLKLHNSGRVRSTKSIRPFLLIYQEKYEDRYEAFRIERYYKTPKGKKELLIKIIINN